MLLLNRNENTPPKKGGLRNKNLNDYYFLFAIIFEFYFLFHTHTHTHTHILIFGRINTKQLLW
jgi:hypothetical protein